jgi:NOL1/NOP2/fmu family ribosome biogenesis protein
VANLATLNSKERKRIIEQLESQYGGDLSFLKAFTFLHQENRDKYYIANEELFELPLDELKVETLGLYIGGRLKNGEIRLSIEGSQLIGPKAEKNILELSDEEFHLWIRGNDIEKETDLQGFLIIKHGDDFVGSGKPVNDEQQGRIIIHNYVPKTRYVRSDD